MENFTFLTSPVPEWKREKDKTQNSYDDRE